MSTPRLTGVELIEAKSYCHLQLALQLCPTSRQGSSTWEQRRWFKVTSQKSSISLPENRRRKGPEIFRPKDVLSLVLHHNSSTLNFTKGYVKFMKDVLMIMDSIVMYIQHWGIYIDDQSSWHQCHSIQASQQQFLPLTLVWPYVKICQTWPHSWS